MQRYQNIIIIIIIVSQFPQTKIPHQIFHHIPNLHPFMRLNVALPGHLKGNPCPIPSRHCLLPSSPSRSPYNANQKSMDLNLLKLKPMSSSNFHTPCANLEILLYYRLAFDPLQASRARSRKLARTALVNA